MCYDVCKKDGDFMFQKKSPFELEWENTEKNKRLIDEKIY